MIPGLIQAFQHAVTRLSNLLRGARDELRMHGPLMGDPVSIEFMHAYNRYAVEDPRSVYGVLVGYQQELQNVVDNLEAMAERYRRTEGDNAALWARLPGVARP